MARGIVGVHWDEVVVPGWRPGSVLALWPAPVDHDQCFAAAGFTAFADTDDDWDRDLEALVDRVFAALGVAPDPPLSPPHPWPQRLWRPVPELGPRAALLGGMIDDRFPPREITVGHPVHSAVLVSAGHPILWVWTADPATRAATIAAAAEGFAPTRMALAWSHLLPAPP